MNPGSKKNMTHVRAFTKKLNSELQFDGSTLETQNASYVFWLDLMGAGSLMRTSMPKTANALARLHLSAIRATQRTQFEGSFLPINDGLFAFSANKIQIMCLAQWCMIFLASRFIETHEDQNRVMVKGGIAYGPIVHGSQLAAAVVNKKKGEGLELLDRACFGPPVIQAYETERLAAPFGISVHESARSFAPFGVRPFSVSQWLWWQPVDGSSHPNAAPLTDLKDCLASQLDMYLKWMGDSLIFNGLDRQKIETWKLQVTQYFTKA